MKVKMYSILITNPYSTNLSLKKCVLSSHVLEESEDRGKTRLEESELSYFCSLSGLRSWVLAVFSLAVDV